MSWDEILIKAGGEACVVEGAATLNCIPAVFVNIILALLIFVGITSLVFIIFSGYKYINSGGDPKKIEGARETITYALVGLILVLFSYFIIRLISGITIVPCILKIGFGC